jgi:antitoxin ParD1/3/4
VGGAAPVGMDSLAKLSSDYRGVVSTMNVSLHDELRSFVDQQGDQGRYSSTSEYVRALIRRDQDRQQLRTLLLDGARSEPGPIADADYFASLRRHIDAAR